MENLRLSVYLDISVGQHPHIIRLLKGVFNSRPPTVKLVPELDLPKILTLLRKPLFEPFNLAPLKYTPWKQFFLQQSRRTDEQSTYKR